MRCSSRSLLLFFFFFNDTATTEIYTLSLHDALPISSCSPSCAAGSCLRCLRRRHRSEEHTSELQSRGLISYAVFCLKKKKHTHIALTCFYHSEGASNTTRDRMT